MDYINDFLAKHPIYSKITYSSSNCPVEVHLHPVLAASQAIIDSLIESGYKRIAVVMPDDDSNIIPLIVSKYLSNIQEIPDYAHNLFNEIQPGQHLKLGKAIVEFRSYDKDKKVIELRVGKTKQRKYGNTTITTVYPSTYWSPFKNFHLYFEKSNGSLTTRVKYELEQKRISEQIEENGIADLDLLALKRTVLNKTIAVISPKNDFKEFLDDFYITGKKFKDVVTYGELNDSCKDGVFLYNPGRLDCLPGVTVSSKISELYQWVVSERNKDKIEAIVVTQAKFDEAINNMGDFRNCLRTEIPIIMFVPETEFDSFPVLAEMGFEFWNWDTNMLELGGFASKEFLSPNNSLFGNLSKIVYNASTSTSDTQSIKYSDLQKCNYIIRQTIKKSIEIGGPINQVTRQMNKLIKVFIDLLSPISGKIKQTISDLLIDLDRTQNILKSSYDGTDIWGKIRIASDMLHRLFDDEVLPKSLALLDLVELSNFNKTVVIVPDRYVFIDDLQKQLNSIYSGGNILVLNASEFCRRQSSDPMETDHLIITFFDRNEYLRLKKTYCYKKITFLLYSFENAWRKGFVNKYKSCIQRESVERQARRIISQQASMAEEVPLDLSKTDEHDEIEEISEFDFERELITCIIKRSNTSSERSDSAECVPVVFNQDTLGFFSPNHNLIDITPLCHGELDRPVKTDASKLQKGNIVLIRQSDKDIIYEKANELMSKRGELSLRSKAERWVMALQQFAEGKDITSIRESLIQLGANCEPNQVRYWLLGETIRPENDRVVEALSILCPDILPEEQVQEVLKSGAKVQEYHREAGRWLTSELKYKAGDILSIFQSGQAKGRIDEIGDVNVYVVEAVFDREYIDRNKINRLEVIS